MLDGPHEGVCFREIADLDHRDLPALLVQYVGQRLAPVLRAHREGVAARSEGGNGVETAVGPHQVGDAGLCDVDGTDGPPRGVEDLDPVRAGIGHTQSSSGEEAGARGPGELARALAFAADDPHELPFEIEDEDARAPGVDDVDEGPLPVDFDVRRLMEEIVRSERRQGPEGLRRFGRGRGNGQGQRRGDHQSDAQGVRLHVSSSHPAVGCIRSIGIIRRPPGFRLGVRPHRRSYALTARGILIK